MRTPAKLIPLTAAVALLAPAAAVHSATRFTDCVGTAKNGHAYCHHRVTPADKVGAALTDHIRANTAYRVCWTRPGGKKTCRSETTGARGRLSFVRIRAVTTLGSRGYGRWTVRWYLGGGTTALSTWRFTVASTA